jgi:NAD(P)-dependent dehydrogenase (short-subunit alcohol dehydrogenase family)
VAEVSAAPGARIVVVAGAGGALGHAVAQVCAAAGAQVHGVDQRLPAAERQLAGVSYHALDLLDDDAVRAWFDAEPVPWAVLNAVGGFAGARPIEELDLDELTAQLRLNLFTAATLTKHAIRRMRPVSAGRVVHTASRAATVLDGVGFAYSVSKLAVLHLVTMAAREVRAAGITVNAIVPSIMDTPANRAAMPGAAHDTWPSVAQVAQVFGFLASPEAELVSSAAIPIYGRT